MQNKPKICHLLLGAANEVAGIQKYIVSLLGPDSLLVINAAPLFEKHLQQKKIKFFTYKNIFWLKEFLIKQKINILHCHLGQAAFWAFILKRFIPGLKLIYTQHFITPAHVNAQLPYLKNIFFKLIFTRFTKLVAISQAVARGILARKEIDRSKLVVIYNGLNLPRAKPKNVPQRNILTVCRLQIEKKPEEIISLAQMLPDYQFTVLGAGRLLKNLRQAAPYNCRFLGYVDNVAKYFQENSFFFFPAPEEPFGYVIVEALANGLPVIAKQGGALPELVPPPCGLLIKDSQQLLEAKKFIEQLTIHPQKYKKYSRNATQQAKNFSLEKMKMELNKVYLEALKNG